MPDTVDIVIADDHPLVRTGLRQVIEREDDLVVVAEAGDGAEACDVIMAHRPHIAILDLEMPKLNGLDVARRVKREKIPAILIILTMYDEERMFNEAMDIGALGYILKDSASVDIVRGIRTVLRGEYYISPALSGYSMKKRNADANDPDDRIGLLLLTPSERRVLKLVAENKTSAEIAEALAISPRTVDNHRGNICRKLSLNGTHALLRFALMHRGRM